MTIVIVLLLIFISYQLFVSNDFKKRDMEKEDRDAERILDHIEYTYWKRDRYDKRLETENGKKRKEYEREHPEEAEKRGEYDIVMKEYIVKTEMKDK